MSIPLSFPRLPSLTSLSLDVCRLTDVHPGELPQTLRSISINGNRLTSLRALAGCNKITHLVASHNRLTELVQSTQTFPDLVALDVSSNRLTSLPQFGVWSPLVGCVTASHNRIRSWPASLHAPLLRELHLNGNALDEFGPVGFLPLLRFLDLSDNRITCIEWVGGCPLLDTLLLARNQIAAFSALRPLATLRELRALHLEGNPVTSSILYPSSLRDICPTLEQVDGELFELNLRKTATSTVLSPSYVIHWLNGTLSPPPPPIDKELPAWWNFHALVKLCKSLSLDASEMAARYISFFISLLLSCANLNLGGKLQVL